MLCTAVPPGRRDACLILVIMTRLTPVITHRQTCRSSKVSGRAGMRTRLAGETGREVGWGWPGTCPLGTVGRLQANGLLSQGPGEAAETGSAREAGC